MFHRFSSVTAIALVLGLTSSVAFAQGRLANPGQTYTADGRPAGQKAFVDPGPGGPAPRQVDGHPDLTGYWKTIREEGHPAGNLGKDYPAYKLPFTPEGEKAYQYDLTHTRDPEALCILGGAPRLSVSGMGFEIQQTSHRAAFLYAYTTYRTVPIDGRPHEADPDPKFFGNAAGSWDGDVFVVDSVGFHDSADGKIWADENGAPQSSQARVIERWTRPDQNHLHLELLLNDSKYYREPVHLSHSWVLGDKPGEGIKESACNENNLDADNIGFGPGYIGPDGNRGYEPSAKLPDAPPSLDDYASAKPAKSAKTGKKAAK